MTDPDSHRRPWCGTVRLTCAFELQMDHEDDATTAEQAGEIAKRQLEDALFAASVCPTLSRNHRNVLAAWQDTEIVELEPETNP
jgi:hypothetical protein